MTRHSRSGYDWLREEHIPVRSLRKGDAIWSSVGKGAYPRWWEIVSVPETSGDKTFMQLAPIEGDGGVIGDWTYSSGVAFARRSATPENRKAELDEMKKTYRTGPRRVRSSRKRSNPIRATSFIRVNFRNGASSGMRVLTSTLRSKNGPARVGAAVDRRYPANIGWEEITDGDGICSCVNCPHCDPKCKVCAAQKRAGFLRENPRFTDRWKRRS